MVVAACLMVLGVVRVHDGALSDVFVIVPSVSVLTLVVVFSIWLLFLS